MNKPILLLPSWQGVADRKKAANFTLLEEYSFKVDALHIKDILIDGAVQMGKSQ